MLEVVQAHGLDAGPTQRPLSAGAFAGLFACVPALLVLLTLRSTQSVASSGLALVGFTVLNVCAGVVYGGVFQRAANDTRGGWLFGLSFGFVVWMLLAVPVLQWLPQRPTLIGYPAVGLFLGQLLWGWLLGLLFPFVSGRLRINMRSTSIGPEAASRRGQK